ncbi:tRNA (adenosine(37)-N6)-dimethylallyltransferase MiaA [Candidatus Avoscillospira sp. LCP25S3_F1]|uniref:tRNA (adenosine(37)-N6)-dimethylallyltransferase MiaA n=1 Tax=Candidatus Avoscillospira sp. LCP25S3_F1 TaxID=3438825 RepID=UPI003F939622
MHDIIAVVGPTASGKTGLAIGLAKALDGEVLSCDSMQLYRHMDIGTATPTAEEMDGIPHHMMNVIDPAEDFSVSRYVEMADQCLRDILARGKRAIVCGGTGLYLDSLLLGRSFACPATGHRRHLEEQAAREGIEPIRELLRTVDPDSYTRLPAGDHRRIIRAAEVYLETGVTITEHNRRTKLLPPRYEARWIGLDFVNRAALYARIDRRVEQMMAQGLLEELQALLDRGVPPTATSLQAIGYKEPMAALRGEITMEEAVAKIQQESRRYAKRQLTWFRRNPAIAWIVQPDEPDAHQTLETALHLLEDGISGDFAP